MSSYEDRALTEQEYELELKKITEKGSKNLGILKEYGKFKKEFNPYGKLKELPSNIISSSENLEEQFEWFRAAQTIYSEYKKHQYIKEDRNMHQQEARIHNNLLEFAMIIMSQLRIIEDLIDNGQEKEATKWSETIKNHIRNIVINPKNYYDKTI